MPLSAFHYADIQLKTRPNSRYPLRKFPLLRDGVKATGLIQEDQLFAGAPVSFERLCASLDPNYVEAVRSGTLSEAQLREMGFLWSKALYERSRRIVGCTLEAARRAKEDGASIVLGGGAHHGHFSFGRGFCVFNDIAICAKEELRNTSGSVAVLDLDVHQGDGTAAILANEPRAYTCSIHAESNFPFRKEKSDLDIGLRDECTNEQYLEAVDYGLDASLSQENLSLLIYVAGADPYVEDKLGRLRISQEALAERDSRVLQACYEKEIPVVIVFGGGYCEPIEITVELYFQTIEIARDIFF